MKLTVISYLLLGACEMIHIFIRNAQTCNKYAENIRRHCTKLVATDGVVDIVIELWSRQPRNQLGHESFIFLSVQNDSGAHPTSYLLGTGAVSSELKRAWRKSNHSTPSSAEGKKECRYVSAPLETESFSEINYSVNQN